MEAILHPTGDYQGEGGNMIAKVTGASSGKGVQMVRIDHRGTNIPINGGLITAGVGVAIGGYSLVTGSPMTPKWAWTLIAICVVIGFLFVLAKLDNETVGGRE